MSADETVPYKSVAEAMGALQKAEIPVIIGDF
jgi:biopolymer transport protein ExbD